MKSVKDIVKQVCIELSIKDFSITPAEPLTPDEKCDYNCSCCVGLPSVELYSPSIGSIFFIDSYDDYQVAYDNTKYYITKRLTEIFILNN